MQNKFINLREFLGNVVTNITLSVRFNSSKLEEKKKPEERKNTYAKLCNVIIGIDIRKFSFSISFLILQIFKIRVLIKLIVSNAYFHGCGSVIIFFMSVWLSIDELFS